MLPANFMQTERLVMLVKADRDINSNNTRSTQRLITEVAVLRQNLSVHMKLAGSTTKYWVK